MSRIGYVLVLVVVAAAALPTAASALTLSDPVALPKSLPGDGQMQGGEPSMAFDPSGDGHLYSVAPGGSDKGVNFWASPDRGNTWNYVRTIGSSAGGGDSDVEVGIDHKVYALDLEVASSAVCRSTDFGKTFGDGCETGQAEDQAGAEEDRQWLSHDPNDAAVTYFNYHDFALQAPIILKSTDGGSSYNPCGNLLNPASPLFPSSIGNTIVGKSAVAKDGMIYVPIGAPTPTQVAQGASTGAGGYGQIVIASHKGCNNDQFDNTTVYSNDGGSFSNLFISNAVGPDGALFVVASGKLTADSPYNTYVWVSRDQAKTFSKPIQVNTSDLTTNVMSAIAAGNNPGEVAVVWYGAQNAKSDPNDTKAEWRFYMARSEDYGATWDRAAVTPNTFHYGDICTVGILCTSGNRNLLDFSSVAFDPKTDCATTIFPGDPFDTFDREASGDTDNAAAYISREACAAKAPAAGGTGGTGSKGEVLGVSAGCHDHTPPVTFVSKRSRFTRRGITLRGTARDKGCGPKGRGTVSHVSLAISHRVGKRCQWLKPNGGFGRRGSCTRKTYVEARGTSKWTFKLKKKLKKGTYAVVPRAIDSVGNLEKPVRGSRRAKHNHNRYLFKVR